jgi:hypothetical protein
MLLHAPVLLGLNHGIEPADCWPHPAHQVVLCGPGHTGKLYVYYRNYIVI